jgi:DNA-binding transcriptional regulator YiaG
MGRGVYSTFRLDEKDKQTINTFNLLCHYIATGVIDGIPLAYVQKELFDWEKIYIAKNIRQLRMLNNMTLTVLARKLDISYSALAKYETCRRKPSDSTLRKLARIFRVDVSEFKKEVDV